MYSKQAMMGKIDVVQPKQVPRVEYYQKDFAAVR
jgi:hypothetical protein